MLLLNMRACVHAVTLSKNANNWATINKLTRFTDGGAGGGGGGGGGGVGGKCAACSTAVAYIMQRGLIRRPSITPSSTVHSVTIHPTTW